VARRCEDALFAEAGQLELVVTLALTICVPSPRYVSNLSTMSQNSNMIIVPDKPNDIAGVVATALSIGNTIKSERK